MTDFTRLTVIGSLRRAELVVPDDEALGGLLPRVMELLDEPAGPVARPLTLIRLTGEQVDAGLTAAEQQLTDGEQLRLIRADDAPPPPEVADVTDVVGDSYAGRAGRWSTTARHSLAAVTIGAGACMALLVHPVSVPVGITALVALCLAAVVAGRIGWPGAVPYPAAAYPPAPQTRTGHESADAAGGAQPWLTIACTAAAAGISIPVGRTLLMSSSLVGSAAPGTVTLLWAAVTLTLIWIVLGFGVGVGLRSRPAIPGALVGAGLIALPLALAASGLTGDQSLVIGVVAAVVVCGLLPWYALSASGLTGLDDQVLAGRPSRRPDVLRTVEAAYRTLSWSTVAVAVPLGAGAGLLATSTNRWAMILGLMVITVTALRTRSFPLIVQQFALGLAAVAATTVAVLSPRPSVTPVQVSALVVGFVVVVALAAGVSPAAHHRARLRRFGNLLEAIAVISLAPLLLGSFGVFTDLIGKFR